MLPCHVPPSLVRDFNYLTMPGMDSDPHRAWKQVQQDGPDIFWTPHFGGHWVVTRGALIKEIYETVADFSSEVIALPREERPEPYRLAPLELDPPEHTDYRRLLNPAFSPKALQSLEDRIRELTCDLIDGFQADGHCEFVGAFALRMPVSIFMHMVDLPVADLPRLLEWADMVIHHGGDLDRARNGSALMAGYAHQKIQERRASPGGDLISHVIGTQVNGRLLTDGEAVGVVSLLLFGGLDTVAAMLSFSLRHLAEHPEQRRQLIAEPALLANAVEELFRRFSVPSTARLVSRDHDFHGVLFRKGDLVLAPNILYNLDDRLWPDPLRVDFTRKDARQHLTFNAGPHRCVGAPLARMELRIVLEEWLKRIPDFQVPDGVAIRAKAGAVVGLAALPLSWPVAA
jgi:cytochrome P450